MFEKILYPTDFSDVSKKALEYVKKLKEAGTKEVIVLHVLDTRSFGIPDAEVALAADVEKLEQAREENAIDELRGIEAELEKRGFDVTVRMETGTPFTEILRVEDEEDVSAVVIGSHGKSMVQEMLLGSVSEKVIRKSKKPVMVVRR